MPATSLIGIPSPIRQVAKAAAASAPGCEADTGLRLGAPNSFVATGANDATGGFVGWVAEFGGSVTTAPAGTHPARAVVRMNRAMGFFMEQPIRTGVPAGTSFPPLWFLLVLAHARTAPMSLGLPDRGMPRLAVLPGWSVGGARQNLDSDLGAAGSPLWRLHRFTRASASMWRIPVTNARTGSATVAS